MFSSRFFKSFLFSALLSISGSASAQVRAIMEGVPAQRYAITVDTGNARVLISTAITGEVLVVGSTDTSNFDFNQSGGAKSVVFISSDSNTTVGGGSSFVIRQMSKSTNTISGLEFSRWNGANSGSNRYPVTSFIEGIHGYPIPNNYSTGALAFGVSKNINSAPTEVLRIIGSGGFGNVSVGTTTAFSKFNISGISSNSTWLSLMTSDWDQTATGSSLHFYPGASSGNTYSVIDANTSGNSVKGTISINPSGGTIGMGGVSSPSAQLHIKGYVPAGAQGSVLYLDPFGSIGDGGLQFGYQVAVGSSPVIQAFNNKNILIEPNGGGVGIGTTTVSNSALLDVVGGGIASGSSTAATIRGKTPGRTGILWNCTDCATVPYCTSTGTVVGAWSLITNKTSVCQ